MSSTPIEKDDFPSSLKTSDDIKNVIYELFKAYLHEDENERKSPASLRDIFVTENVAKTQLSFQPCVNVEEKLVPLPDDVSFVMYIDRIVEGHLAIMRNGSPWIPGNLLLEDHTTQSLVVKPKFLTKYEEKMNQYRLLMKKRKPEPVEKQEPKKNKKPKLEHTLKGKDDKGTKKEEASTNEKKAKNGTTKDKTPAVKPSKEVPEDAPKEKTKEKTKEKPKEKPKDKPKEKSKEATKDKPKETNKENPKEVTKEKSKEPLKESTKEKPKETPKEKSKEQPKESSKTKPVVQQKNSIDVDETPLMHGKTPANDTEPVKSNGNEQKTPVVVDHKITSSDISLYWTAPNVMTFSKSRTLLFPNPYYKKWKGIIGIANPEKSKTNKNFRINDSMIPIIARYFRLSDDADSKKPPVSCIRHGKNEFEIKGPIKIYTPSQECVPTDATFRITLKYSSTLMELVIGCLKYPKPNLTAPLTKKENAIPDEEILEYLWQLCDNIKCEHIAQKKPEELESDSNSE